MLRCALGYRWQFFYAGGYQLEFDEIVDMRYAPWAVYPHFGWNPAWNITTSKLNHAFDTDRRYDGPNIAQRRNCFP
jgi:hypothetical protein